MDIDCNESWHQQTQYLHLIVLAQQVHSTNI